MRKKALRCTAGLMALMLAACRSGDDGAVDRATVTRSGEHTYTVTWRAIGGPVDVYVAARPDAPRQAMRQLVDNDGDGTASIRLDRAERPYFYVTVDGGRGLWVGERVLPLEGGRNFRDLGGYPTVDGKHVKWGKVFRSGDMAGLTPADYRYLSGLGIRVVCDLRTTRERSAGPNRWAEAAKIAYWTRDYDMSGGDLRRLLALGGTPEQMRATMIASYRQLPTEQAPAYREIFQRLAAGEIPLAFNCSAGKDRAGTAAALILSALGVPDETVFADYALSDRVLNSQRPRAGHNALRAFGPLAQLSPDTLRPLLASDPDYIRAAFAAIREKHGSVHQYLRDELGITNAQLATIRGELLE